MKSTNTQTFQNFCIYCSVPNVKETAAYIDASSFVTCMQLKRNNNNGSTRNENSSVTIVQEAEAVGAENCTSSRTSNTCNSIAVSSSGTCRVSSISTSSTKSRSSGTKNLNMIDKRNWTEL